MPTIKPGSKDTTKLIGAQVTTPRKARNKSKKNKPSASVADMRALPEGEDKAELRRSRSQSRRRRLFEAVAARVDLRRSRSRSKGRSKTSTLEISGPIIQPRVVSEVFGQSPILYPLEPANLDARASETTRQSQIPTGVSLRSSVYRTSPVDRGQKAQSFDPSWDSTEAFRANCPQDPFHHPLPPEVPVTRQFNAPDDRDTTILQLLQNAEKSNERFCNVCYKPVNTEDRYNLIGRVLHRWCFTCSRCTAPLANRSAVCQNGVWSCAHHVQYQLNNGSDIAEDKAKKESVVETKEAPERRSTNVGAQRMGNLRNKFETGEVGEKKKKKKAAPKIKYAGAESVKNKFIETASKKSNGTANGPRGPKEITPPPEGVAVGVLESKPKPRDPDVVTADDTLDPVDLSIIGETTKNLRAKFKHLEETGGQLEEEDKPKQNALIDEYKSVAPEATRSARARWKDIESGKVEKSTEERPKIDIRGEGYGGVFENEPEKLENITRSGGDARSLPAGISARERREEFLRRANEAASLKKEPVRVDINAAEGGIYENEPTRREDVVRYDDEQNDDYPSASAKWASEAKDRFMQEASKAQEQVQRTKPIAVVETEANGEGTAECRFASQAKQALIERQRQEEEAAKNKARPDIIDIWGEQCAESGVFENVPAARSADVVAGGMTDEEESEEESEEE